MDANELASKHGDKIRVNAIASSFFIGNQNRRLLAKEDGSCPERGNSIIKNTRMARFGYASKLNGMVHSASIVDLNTNISGVSLNWMIGQLREFELLPSSASVYENRMDMTNNPRKGIIKLFYPKKGRKLVFFTSRNGYKKEKLKLHQSVLDRLEGSLQTYEVNLIKLFGECFKKNGKGGYDYLEASDCFYIEN